MTEKGFQFRCELKEKSAKAAHKSFHATVTAFHAFLAGTIDRDQIDRKLKDIIAQAEKTELELIVRGPESESLPPSGIFADMYHFKASPEGI